MREDGVPYARAKRRVARQHPELSNPAILYNAAERVKVERRAAGHVQAAQTRAARRWAAMFAAAELNAGSPPGAEREQIWERRRGLGQRTENISRLSVNFVDPFTGELREADIYMARRERETEERRASRGAVAIAEAEQNATYERIAELYSAILGQIASGNYTMENA